LAEAADARVERGQLERPLPRVGGDLHDAAVHHVGVDRAAPSAVVAAGAGYDGLALAGVDARSFVDGAWGHDGFLLGDQRITIAATVIARSEAGEGYGGQIGRAAC